MSTLAAPFTPESFAAVQAAVPRDVAEALQRELQAGRVMANHGVHWPAKQPGRPLPPSTQVCCAADPQPRLIAVKMGNLSQCGGYVMLPCGCPTPIDSPYAAVTAP